MAYADRKDGGNKVVAIIIVALIHAVIGYAFVTGLAYQYVKKVSEKLNTFDVAPPPPPPPDEPPPPPPPDQPQTPPPVVSPPPIVQNPNPPPQTVVTVREAPPQQQYTTAPPAPPAPPPPPRVSQAAGARGDEASWVTQDDYPPSALREEKEGTSVIAWTINTQGRIENCRTVQSSGSSDLDDAACRALTRRGRYTPAKDQDGNPISTTKQRRVRWVIPQ
ncbi:MAG: energy transducer TonB [Sphingomonas sp. 28-62-20]|uniref:energy transducer TonB n=1 Tax=Sphingomonas sp. 28-62-20 TaxID=1970433 RepID=UPI000A99EABF|nr:MAG: energy transducer TonB [Sphingomonas sp. 28-62-20]